MQPVLIPFLAVGGIIALLGMKFNRVLQVIAAYLLMAVLVFLFMRWIEAKGDVGFYALACGLVGGLAAGKFRQVGQFAIGAIGAGLAFSLFTSIAAGQGMMLPPAGWGAWIHAWVVDAKLGELPRVALAPITLHGLDANTVALMLPMAAAIAGTICIAFDFYAEVFFITLLGAVLAGIGASKAVVILGAIPIGLVLQYAINRPKRKDSKPPAEYGESHVFDAMKPATDDDPAESQTH